MASPVAVTQLPLGTKLAAVFQVAAQILSIVANVAAVSNTQDSWEHLEVALRGLERAHLRKNGYREYELVKHITLRLHSPLAFLQLGTWASANSSRPGGLSTSTNYPGHHLGYPGHYLRRIKNLPITIPCGVGPYAGVHCRVPLLSSGLRLEPNFAHGRKVLAVARRVNRTVGPLS